MVRFVVHWPVVELRSLPGDSPSPWNGRRWLRDPFLDSQLLHGDHVELLGEQGSWAFVAVPTQPRFRQHWQPYTGWIPAQAIKSVEGSVFETLRSFSLPLHASPEGPQQGMLSRGSRLHLHIGARCGGWQQLATGGWIQTAAMARAAPPSIHDVEGLAGDWLGTPYLWGGTSAYLPTWEGHRSGVDCSGLIWAIWRALGKVVPRDAHDQWLAARPLAAARELRRGDLVFLSGPEPHARIHHVMLALDQQRLIEASGSRGCVHESLLAERCHAHPETPNGAWTGSYRVWFGRFPDVTG